MKLDSFLNKAAILAKKRDYEGALNVLKDEEERYYGSFKYYYLYGIICLYSGNYAQAHENFNLARKIKINDPDLMLCFAVLYLKRMDTVQAVHYYLEVQELDQKNKIAKKALAVIRKYSAGEALSDWMTENLSKLFPPIPAPSVTPKTILNISLIFAAAVILVFGILITVKVLPNPFKSKNQRSTADFNLSDQDKRESVQVGGNYRYILTRDQAVNLYDKALSLFTSYRDEEAKKSINRILESNASQGIKNRARLLLDNMEVPGFDNFKRADNPSFADVKNESAIYRNVHVIWKGMATNVAVTDEGTTFDLLVGYDTRKTLEGIVPVIFSGPVSINTEKPLEVLGRITFDSSSDIKLEGVAIHQSGKLE
ncbi:tetratricopeptide repeat protein [Treponema sp. R80B11-R83G3]